MMTVKHEPLPVGFICARGIHHTLSKACSFDVCADEQSVAIDLGRPLHGNSHLVLGLLRLVTGSALEGYIHVW